MTTTRTAMLLAQYTKPSSEMLSSEGDASPLSPTERPRSTPPEHWRLERTLSSSSVSTVESAGLLLSSTDLPPANGNANVVDFEPPKHGPSFRAGHELLVSLLTAPDVTNKRGTGDAAKDDTAKPKEAKRGLEITRKTFEDDEMIAYRGFEA